MFSFFKRSYTAEEKKIFRFLRQNTFFSTLSEDEMYEFLPFMYVRHYEKGEVIFFRGDPSQGLYLINKGIVTLNIDVEDKFEELTHMRPTEVFGTNALLENRKRIYNAICFSDRCELYVIPATNIQEVFENNKHIKAKVMMAMAEYYDHYMSNLFRVYQESFGFFDLGRTFVSSQ
ncbi:cyclic nucleotide-binding domain-containing protein [Algivirga pacifica]|uniref:Cyclic nucleotide-binding domain-containing protein n=1 Tax=Algivirga pacifica TaxID=1162670 RepID=A0ABP9D242_9BACT